jgi:hypothetical protein
MNILEINELKKKFGEFGSLTSTQIIELKNKLIGKGKPKKKPKPFIPPLDYRLDLFTDVKDFRDYKFNITTFDQSGLGMPNKIDWTSKMSPVKDQGKLGSCVGFATAAMKEWQEQQEHLREVAAGKRDHRKGKDNYDLSEAWIYWNCKKIDPWPDSQGTSIRCAMKVLQKIGVPCEDAYPYSDKFRGEPTKWAKLISKWGLIDSYWRVRGIDDLRLALVNGPVVIGIACFREIFSPDKNGNVRYPRNPNELLGGHAICAVGFNDNTRKIKFKNSWSTGWGKNGYGTISYRYVNDFMWDAWACKDLSVTRKIIQERGKDELI